jgi:hypothetical protein
MEPTETDNVFMMVKSVDGGQSWFEVDEENRPQISDLEGLGSVMTEDGIIHIVHQISEGVYHHAFAIADHQESKDRWIVDSHLIATHDKPPTQTADVTLRSDGSLVAVFAIGDQLQYSMLDPTVHGAKQKFLIMNTLPVLPIHLSFACPMVLLKLHTKALTVKAGPGSCCLIIPSHHHNFFLPIWEPPKTSILRFFRWFTCRKRKPRLPFSDRTTAFFTLAIRTIEMHGPNLCVSQTVRW